MTEYSISFVNNESKKIVLRGNKSKVVCSILTIIFQYENVTFKEK